MRCERLVTSMSERIIHTIARANDGALYEVGHTSQASVRLAEQSTTLVHQSFEPTVAYEPQQEILTGEVMNSKERRHLSPRAVRRIVKVGGVALVLGSLYGATDYTITRVMYGRELSFGDVVEDVIEVPGGMMDRIDSARSFIGGVQKVEEVKNTLTGDGK